jgi:DNA-binding MarR family transcriptional regulator
VRSNITQLVDRLEKDGLVRRVNDATDRRLRRAALTAAGRKAAAEAVRVWTAYEREVAATLGQGDAVALDRMLGQMSK